MNSPASPYQDYIAIQTEDFNTADEYRQLTQHNSSDGAVVSFIGLVRDYNQGHDVIGLKLEHYAGMTERTLAEIVAKAREKWSLGRVRVIHRIGELNLSEQIVWVGVTSPHRQSAFAACEFIIDFLKQQAPFWKKERTASGERWVEAEVKDQAAEDKWA